MTHSHSRGLAGLCAVLALALFSAPAMAQTKTIAAPSSIVPTQGVCFGAIGDAATCVSAATPLPVTSAAAPADVTGSKSGGTAAASSLLTGGVYSSTPPTLTNGQQAAGQLGARGSTRVELREPDGSTNNAYAVGPQADGLTNGLSQYLFGTYNRVFNGTTWDRVRGDTTGIYVREQQRSSYNVESATPLASAATFTGSSRDAASAIVGGTNSAWAYFNGFFFADQAGTASIEVSTDASTWRTAATAAVAASAPLVLQVPVMARYHRVKLVNGATLQTAVMVNSSYSAN